ncbi:MAG: hypothetical protein K9M56_00895 [Victivallales bacterium]|nr:hypothetical protein [Victivallales bacterium]
MILEEVKGLYRIITLKKIRKTNKVTFDALDVSLIPHAEGFDRVIHEPGAISPGTVHAVKQPWYMHPHQEDNLMVLHGTRYIEIYTPEHGSVEKFTVTADKVCKGNKVCYNGAAMLVWPRNVFHRIKSCPVQGSASINFAVRFEGFDIRTNFNIYDLDVKSGRYKVIREGHLDQNF